VNIGYSYFFLFFSFAPEKNWRLDEPTIDDTKRNLHNPDKWPPFPYSVFRAALVEWFPSKYGFHHETCEDKDMS